MTELRDDRPGATPKKLMCTCDNEEDLRELLSEFAAVAYDKGIDWELDKYGYQVPSFKRCSRNLESLHVIAINRQSELTGLPMPITELEMMRSGSLSEAGIVHYVDDWPTGAERQNDDEPLGVVAERDDRARVLMRGGNLHVDFAAVEQRDGAGLGSDEAVIDQFVHGVGTPLES